MTKWKDRQLLLFQKRNSKIYTTNIIYLLNFKYELIKICQKVQVKTDNTNSQSRHCLNSDDNILPIVILMNYAHTYYKTRITIAISYRSFTNPNSEKFEIYCLNLFILVIMYQRMPKRFKIKIKSFFFSFKCSFGCTTSDFAY